MNSNNFYRQSDEEVYTDFIEIEGPKEKWTISKSFDEKSYWIGVFTGVVIIGLSLLVLLT
jgi:hypothetical protein